MLDHQARSAVRLASASVLLAAIGAGASAQAANGATPRTRPVFNDEACLQVVDRSVDPILRFDVDIPYEDVGLTPDELPDSRRFQFVALCRDHVSAEPLPAWIAQSDAERALEGELIQMLPPADAVLESASAWSSGHDGESGSCVRAITPTDARIPISCDATEGGVQWDTRGVPAGNYVVRGYTFEPPLNVWTTRRGVVQVVDGDERPPVVALMSPGRDEQRTSVEAGYELLGCIGGPQGTVVELAFIAATDLIGDAPPWSVFETLELDPSNPDFAVMFEPPPEAASQAVLFRAVAIAPSGERWTAYAPGNVLVLPGDLEADDPVLPAGPDYCSAPPQDSTGTEGELDTGELDSESGESSGAIASAGAEPPSGDGCACRADSHDTSGLTGWLVPVLLLRRRKRRH